MAGIDGIAGNANMAGISGIAGIAGKGVTSGIVGMTGITGIGGIRGASCGRLGAAIRSNPHPARTPVNPTKRVNRMGRIGAPPFLAIDDRRHPSVWSALRIFCKGARSGKSARINEKQ